MRGLGASIVLHLCVGAAAMPGGPESVPEPISAVDLQSYAIVLDVSRHEWLDMLLRHARYRVEYYDTVAPRIRELERQVGLLATVTREDGLEELLPEVRVIATSRIRLFSQIEQLDGSLFDTLVPSLSDQEQYRLRRVRLRRERDRLRGEAMLQGEGITVVDISTPARVLLREEPLDLPRPDVESILTVYEDRLTARERDLQRRSARIYELFVDSLLKADSAVAPGPEERAGRREDAAAIWLEITRPARTELARIHALNRRLLADLESVTPALARRLRHAYCRAVCADVSMSQMLLLSEGWEEAIGRREDVTPEERTAVAAKLAAWSPSMEQLLDECLQRLQIIWQDDNLAAGRWAQEDLCAEKLAHATRQYDDLIRFLTSLLGARSQSLVAARRPWSAIPGIDGPSWHETVSAWTRELRREGTPSLSELKPVELVDLQRLAGRLHWDPDQLEQLNIRYQAYAERFRAELARQSSIIHETYGNRQRTAEGRQTFAQRCAMVIPALDDVDQDLWLSVVAINGMQDRSLIRLARGLRHREVLRSPAWHDRARLPINVSQEWRLDLISMLDGGNPRVAPGSALEACLLEYDKEATRIAKRQHDAALDLLAEMETGTVNRSSDADNTELRRAQEDLAVAYAEAGGLNQRTLGQLAELLPDDRYGQIVVEYRVRSYARLLQDPNDLAPRLGKAMAMDGLDEQTRDALDQASRMYLEEYDRLLNDIREQLSRLQGTTLPQTRRDLLHTYRGELSRFSFHRFDLDASMAMLLQSLLTPAQIAEIGGLPARLPEGCFLAPSPATARPFHENPAAQRRSTPEGGAITPGPRDER